jgi:hypothetical protein
MAPMTRLERNFDMIMISFVWVCALAGLPVVGACWSE